MLLIAAYDIADERRRTRLRKLLLTYGDGVQESVFECTLTVEQIARLKRQVREVIDARVDRVDYYALCASCAAKVEDAEGRPRPPKAAIVVV